MPGAGIGLASVAVTRLGVPIALLGAVRLAAVLLAAELLAGGRLTAVRVILVLTTAVGLVTAGLVTSGLVTAVRLAILVTSARAVGLLGPTGVRRRTRIS